MSSEGSERVMATLADQALWCPACGEPEVADGICRACGDDFDWRAEQLRGWST